MLVEVDDVSLGGGGGDTTPGESIVPANAETANDIVRIATAQIRCNLFTILGPPTIHYFVTYRKIQKFLYQPKPWQLYLARYEETKLKWTRS